MPHPTQITALEDRLRQAMLTSNVAELDALLAPDLLFTTHLGQPLTKSQDLAIHRSGSLSFTALTPSDQQIQCYAGFAVVSVTLHLLGSYAGAAFDEQIRYTRVWADAGAGSLQVVAGQATVVTEA
ncbi:MAG: nuclear transport factor 2 family protein [Spirulina sp. SIO3F2]|nr:nuclear transport factor 2 family protein [Spirulina sp. SIO3F2]